jgi:hypothetical protein
LVSLLVHLLLEPGCAEQQVAVELQAMDLSSDKVGWSSQSRVASTDPSLPWGQASLRKAVSPAQCYEPRGRNTKLVGTLQDKGREVSKKVINIGPMAKHKSHLTLYDEMSRSLGGNLHWDTRDFASQCPKASHDVPRLGHVGTHWSRLGHLVYRRTQ